MEIGLYKLGKLVAKYSIDSISTALEHLKFAYESTGIVHELKIVAETEREIVDVDLHGNGFADDDDFLVEEDVPFSKELLDSLKDSEKGDLK